MRSVSYRYTLFKSKTKGVDPLVDSLLDGAVKETEVFTSAKELLKSPLKKSYIEAGLLACQDPAKISELTEIDLATVRLYRDMFFDVSGMDRLSLLEVIDQSPTPEERSMKMWALSQGLDFLAWRLGKSVSINPVSGLQELFTLCVYKSKEAMFSGNASASSIEATKWTKMSMDLARLLKAWVMDGDAAKRDIEIALLTIEPNFKGLDSL